MENVEKREVIPIQVSEAIFRVIRFLPEDRYRMDVELIRW